MCWVFGTGAPILDCNFEYNKKENMLEMTIKQKPLIQDRMTSMLNNEFSTISEKEFSVPTRLNLMRYYKGSLTIIVHETDANEQDSCIHRIQIEGE